MRQERIRSGIAAAKARGKRLGLHRASGWPSCRAISQKGWFGREGTPAGVALTFECELGYTFDPAVWGQGFATEAVCCVRDYARDVLQLRYAISAILPHNDRSRRVAERSGAQGDGQVEVIGLAWDRYMWPLATGDEARLEPGSPSVQ